MDLRSKLNLYRQTSEANRQTTGTDQQMQDACRQEPEVLQHAPGASHQVPGILQQAQDACRQEPEVMQHAPGTPHQTPEILHQEPEIHQHARYCIRRREHPRIRKMRAGE